MTKPIARCWCGAPLIDGIIDEEGEWFPFGFVNCPEHGADYEVKPRNTKEITNDSKLGD